MLLAHPQLTRATLPPGRDFATVFSTVPEAKLI